MVERGCAVDQRPAGIGARWGYTTILSVALLSIFLLAGCTSGVPVGASLVAAPTTLPSAGPVASEPPGDIRDDRVYSDVEARIWDAVQLLNDPDASPFAEIFGGTVMTHNPSRLVVLLTGRSDEIEGEITKYLELSGEEITFRDTPTTWSQVLATNAQIQADLPALMQRFPINGVGIQGDVQVVIHAFRELDEAERAELFVLYGDAIGFEIGADEFIVAQTEPFWPNK